MAPTRLQKYAVVILIGVIALLARAVVVQLPGRDERPLNNPFLERGTGAEMPPPGAAPEGGKVAPPQPMTDMRMMLELTAILEMEQDPSTALSAKQVARLRAILQDEGDALEAEQRLRELSSTVMSVLTSEQVDFIWSNRQGDLPRSVGDEIARLVESLTILAGAPSASGSPAPANAAAAAGNPMSFEQLIAGVGRIERHATLGLTADQARALLPSLQKFAAWQKSSADRGRKIADLLTPAQEAVVQKTMAAVAAGTILTPVSAEQVLAVLDARSAK